MMVPEVGLEPTWDCSRQILSLVRIPISPLRRELSMIRCGLGEVKNKGRAIEPGGIAKKTLRALRALREINSIRGVNLGRSRTFGWTKNISRRARQDREEDSACSASSA